jgi:hypothetical protein
MPSPFPGMDPYLEGPLWPDVHQALAAEIRRRLAAQLRPRYVARLATRYVADLSGISPVRILYPDVDVTVARPAHEPVTTYEPPVELAPPLVTPPLILSQPGRIPEQALAGDGLASPPTGARSIAPGTQTRVL